MASINNTESLRQWFRTCPVIQNSKRFHIDYLAEDPTEYAIIASPSSLSYHENIIGEEVPDDIQFQNFIFASKESYGPDIQQNLANLGFYQDICDWILEQNAEKNFPEWQGGKIKSIVPTLTVYTTQVETSAAKYQIQIRITYRRL